MRRVTWTILLLALGGATSAIIAFSIHRYVLGPAQAREEAFDDFKSGILVPASDGVIALPESLSSASINGKAYVTRISTTTQWVLFLSVPPTLHQLHGYLFCTLPAKSGPGGVVDLHYPTPDSLTPVKVLRALSPWSYEVINFQ